MVNNNDDKIKQLKNIKKEITEVNNVRNLCITSYCFGFVGMLLSIDGIIIPENPQKLLAGTFVLASTFVSSYAAGKLLGRIKQLDNQYEELSSTDEKKLIRK